MRDRLIAGALLPASLVTRAEKFRRWYKDAVLKLFADVDVPRVPASPCAATLIGKTERDLGGEILPLRPDIGIYTQPFIGLPVAAVPVRGPTLPIGVQLIAAPWREELVLRAVWRLDASGSRSL